MDSKRDAAALVQLTNEILAQIHVSTRVRHVDDITPSIFVLMFEGLCGEVLPDVKRYPRTKEDAIHNCQVVIDTLSLDVLNTSLSHITGEAIVAGDRIAIANLLDVFSGLLEYMLDKIGSDASSVVSGAKSEDFEDPDLVTPEIIDNILQKELSRGSSSRLSRGRNSRSLNGTGNSTDELIQLGNVGSRDWSSPDLSNRTSLLMALGNSTYDATPRSSRERHRLSSTEQSKRLSPRRGPSPTLTSLRRSPSPSLRRTPPLTGNDASGFKTSLPSKVSVNGASAADPLKKRTDSSFSSSVAYPEVPAKSSSGQFDSVGVRPTSDPSRADPVSPTLPVDRSGPRSDYGSGRHRMYEGHIHHGLRDSIGRSNAMDPLSASLPASVSAAATAAVNGTSHKSSSGPLPLSHGHSYDNLESMMRDTVAMSRAAVAGSPLRGQPASVQNDHPNGPEDESEMLRSSLEKVSLSDAGVTNRKGATALTNGSSLLVDSDLNLNSSNGPKSILSPGHKAKEMTNRRKAVTFKSKSSLRVSDTSTDSSKTGSPRVSSTWRAKPPRAKSKGAITGSLRSRPTSRQENVRTHRMACQDPETTNEAPQTFRDYLRKYYGSEHPRLASASDDEVNYNSGSQRLESETSGHDADFIGNFEAELQQYKDKLIKKAKTVRFDDILDDSAPGKMGSLRRKLKAEDLKNRIKQQYLSQVYDEELKDFEEDLWEDMAKERLKSNETNAEFRKKILTPKSKKYKPVKKYSVIMPQRHRPGKKSSVLIKGRKRSASASPAVRRTRSAPSVSSSDDLLPWLLEEFPFLHLSSETIHDLWKKSSRQVEQMSKAEKDMKRKKSKQQEQLEEAERRQKILLSIMQKELAHNRRMREVQERQRQQQMVKSSIREKRLASARSRKYYNEFQVRMRSKMLKKRNKEEMLFKKLFHEGLDIQKDRIRELRKYAKEQREKRKEIQENDLASLENYYKDQFSLLAESMAKERQDMTVRETAQSKMLSQMKLELRQKMEREIKDFQEQLWRDEDDLYFRDLDAERIRQELYRASYQAKI